MAKAKQTGKDSPEMEETAGGEQIHRIGIGLNVTLQILLVLVLFGIVNYLGYRHYQRWDLSPQQKYTLSDASKKVLKTLREDVTVTVAFVKGSEVADDVFALVDEYDRSRKTRVVVDYVDPVRNPSKAEELKNKFGIDNLDKNVIIVSSGDSVRFITEEEMKVRVSIGDGETRVTGFRGEEAITSALLAVTETHRKKVYFLAGKGTLRVANGDSGGTAYQVLEDIGRKQNLALEPLVFSSIQEMPEDASAVILFGPKYDMSEREMDVLRNYWNRRQGSLFVLLNPMSETPRLNAFLMENGIVPQADRVIWASMTGTGFTKRYDVDSYFLPDSPITQPFFGNTTSFGGQTESLKLPLDDDQLLQRGLQVIPLLKAAENYWGEKSYFEEDDSRLKPDETDNLAPVYIAASVERGGVDDPALRVESARMVVVGNSSLLDPDTQVRTNYDFAAATLNWMLDREDIIGIGAVRRDIFRADISPGQIQRLFYIATVLLPCAVLCLGLFSWSVRRS